MCFDPVSLGVAAVGAGLGLYGKSQEQKQQTSQMEAAKNAANAVLAQHLAKQAGYDAENQAFAKEATAGFTPGAQSALLGAKTTNRTNTVTGNMVDPTVPDVPSSGYSGGTDLVRKTNADRVKAAFDAATNSAVAKAKLGAYGDVWNVNNEGITDAARREATVNKLSGMDAALIDPQQTLAQYGAYRAPSSIPAITQSVGGFLGGLAGSGLIGPKKA